MDEPPYDVRTEGCEIWNERTAFDAEPRRVLIAHAESSVGDSFALLLAMRGFEAIQIGSVPDALRFASEWRPQMLFVDTRVGCLDTLHDHALARGLRDQAQKLAWLEAQMLIAFASDETSDPRDALRDAGYDGFVRTPCPVWRMFDLLGRYYTR
jgi:hypothetical protein